MNSKEYYIENLPFLGTDDVRKLNRYFLHPNDQRACFKCRIVFNNISNNFHTKKYDKQEKKTYKCWNSSCKSCSSKENLERSLKNRKDPKTFISKQVSSFKARAKEQSVNFNLDADYLFSIWEKQSGLCFYTHEAISFENIMQSRNYPHILTPSLDRLDPKKGYIKDNVVWCAYYVNRMKNDLNYEDFIKKCGLIFSLH